MSDVDRHTKYTKLNLPEIDTSEKLIKWLNKQDLGMHGYVFVMRHVILRRDKSGTITEIKACRYSSIVYRKKEGWGENKWGIHNQLPQLPNPADY